MEEVAPEDGIAEEINPERGLPWQPDSGSETTTAASRPTAVVRIDFL